MTNNYLQSTTQKPEYSATRTEQKPEVNSDSPEVRRPVLVMEETGVPGENHQHLYRKTKIIFHVYYI